MTLASTPRHRRDDPRRIQNDAQGQFRVPATPSSHSLAQRSRPIPGPMQAHSNLITDSNPTPNFARTFGTSGQHPQPQQLSIVQGTPSSRHRPPQSGQLHQPIPQGQGNTQRIFASAPVLQAQTRPHTAQPSQPGQPRALAGLSTSAATQARFRPMSVALGATGASAGGGTASKRIFAGAGGGTNGGRGNG